MRRLLIFLLVSSMTTACGGAPRPVFDFSANLAQATLRLETRELDFGRPAARSHLLLGWSDDETMPDGRPIVWAIGSRSSLEFDRFTPGPAILRFLIQELPEIPGPQQIAIVVNNMAAGEVVTREPDRPKDTGFRVFNVQAPDSVLRLGRNVVEFRVSPIREPPDDAADGRALAMAWDWLQFGPALLRTTPVALDDELWIPVPARLEYRLNVPADSRLQIDAVRPVGLPAMPADAALHVRVTWDDGAPPELLTVRGPALESGVDLPFGHRAGGWARLSFTALGVPEAPRLDGLDLVAPRLMAVPR